MYDDFFEQAAELQRAGAPFATATVVRAERPTSGKPGDRAIVTADGQMHGWIGGSCAPAGLDIKARRGDEIALSVMAEIVRARREADSVWVPPAPDAPASAEDACPVCGMAVAIAGAKHTYEHAGTTYYFCCPGCRYAFVKSPTSFVAA